MQDVPEFKELVAFMTVQAIKLDSLEDVYASLKSQPTVDHPAALAVELRGRMRAKEILESMLGGFGVVDNRALGGKRDDYVV